MTVVTFKVEGLSGLQEQLLELGAELGAKTLRSAARKAFAPIVEKARSLVPVDSGALRDALRLAVRRPKGGEAVVVVGMRIAAGGGKAQGTGSTASAARKLPPSARWHFVELGTVKMPAHPFARPALDQGAAGALEALKTELAKAIQRAIRKKARAAAGGGS